MARAPREDAERDGTAGREALPEAPPASRTGPGGELEGQLAGLSALDDRVRRSFSVHCASSPQEVSREAAARAVGVTRGLAGFHLVRLVGGGLLEASFRRLTGRSGPGAGRPAQLYRRADRQIDV